MTRDEFDQKLGQVDQDMGIVQNTDTPTSSEYRVIEEVYTFYPTVSNVNGKYQVAWLYRMFGMAVFYDMLPRCRKAKEKELEISRIRRELDRASMEMEVIRKGELDSIVTKNNQEREDAL